MATVTRNCPKCHRALTSTPGDPGRWSCEGCGKSFAFRPKSGAIAAAPANTFAALSVPTEPRPTARSRGGSGSGSGLRMILILGGALAAALLLLVAGAGAAVALLVMRAPVKSPQVAVAAVNDAPVADPASVVAPAPAPIRSDDPKPAVTPKKPDAPKIDPTPAAPPLRADPNPAPPPLVDPTPAPPDPKPMPDPKAPADPINKAIDKAVVYLKQQATNKPQGGPAGPGFNKGMAVMFGRQTGEMGLIGLALLESGVAADDPAVVACTDVVRNAAPTCGNTYEMAISIWFLDRLGDPKDEDAIHDLGARLVAGQLEGGLWTYNCPTGNPAVAAPGFGPAAPFPGLASADLSAEQIKELMDTLTKVDPSKEIPAKQQLAPVCRFVKGKKLEKTQPGLPGKQPGLMFGMGDLSLTQFATLGLWVARKHHVPVDRSVLMTEARVRASQASDNGWAYNAMVGAMPGILGPGMGMGTTDSMTCSGMMELAVARGLTQAPNGKTEAADPQFEKGLQYLAELFDRGIVQGNNPAAPNAAQAGNLAAATGRLMALQANVTNPFLENQPARWKKSLKEFQDEVERDLPLDLPADAKKDLQAVDDEIKKYDAAPSAKEKKSLVDTIQNTGMLQGNGLAAIGLNAGPGRLLKPGKFNRMNMDDIYCLWSLERLCMVCDLKTVAGHDWYAWGANLLVASQKEDGSWTTAGICGPQVDTCLALLFLKRVNVAKDLTAQLKLIAPVKDLSGDKLKYASPGDTPSPGLTTPSPGETPKEAPKP